MLHIATENPNSIAQTTRPRLAQPFVLNQLLTGKKSFPWFTFHKKFVMFQFVSMVTLLYYWGLLNVVSRFVSRMCTLIGMSEIMVLRGGEVSTRSALGFPLFP